MSSGGWEGRRGRVARMLLPLTTYALLLCAGVLSLTSLVGQRTRLMLAVVGAVQVGLLIKWTVTTDCIGSWCAETGGLGALVRGAGRPGVVPQRASAAGGGAARRGPGGGPPLARRGSPARDG